MLRDRILRHLPLYASVLHALQSSGRQVHPVPELGRSVSNFQISKMLYLGARTALDVLQEPQEKSGGEAKFREVRDRTEWKSRFVIHNDCWSLSDRGCFPEHIEKGI